MKLLPRNWLLLALVVCLAGAQVFLRRAPVTAGGEGPLFPDLDLRRVVGIRIEPGEPGELGKQAGQDALVLERAAGGWRVPTAFDHPALAFEVDELLDGLAALRVENRAASEATSHARLGVGPMGTRITLTDAAGEPLLAVVQGVPPEARTEAGAAFAGSYVRRAHDDAVVRAPHLAPVSLEPRAWFDGQLLAFEPAQVSRIAARLANEAVALELHRAADGTWRSVPTQAGDTSDPISLVAVQRLLDAASALWASEAIGPREGPEKDALAQPEVQLMLEAGGTGAGVEPVELGLVVAGPWTTEQRRARAGPVASVAEPGVVGSPTGWPVALSNLSADRLTAAIRTLAGAVDAAQGEASNR